MPRWILLHTLSCFALLVSVNQLAQAKTADTVDVADTEQSTREIPLQELSNFASVLDTIKTYYVYPVTDKKLFEDAIKGMLNGLDPHSSFLDKQEYAELQTITSGQFGGLGIEVTQENGFLKVVSPIDDTPAAKAGVKAGDLIVRINNTPTKGLDLQAAVDMMRGEPGSLLKMTLIRANLEKPLTIQLARDVIRVESVKSSLFEDSYAYVRIAQFQSETAPQVEKAVLDLKKKSKSQMKGMILDLRNNPGGILDAAIAVSSLFLDSQKLKGNAVIVSTKGRLPSADLKESAHAKDILDGLPMVILVNAGSASASEIVAGALQDHKRAVIMGSKTFGKGSVQTVLPLDQETGIKLTTALYYTPNGRSIQAAGIIPDIPIENATVTPEKETDLDTMAEADLKGHIENSNKNLMTKALEWEKKTDKNAEQAKLLENDYPLHEAINLLKGIHIADKGGA
jgi:carboxyl-terminal processing protease